MTDNQETEKRRINMGDGNYNESIGRDYIQYIYNNTLDGNWGKAVAALVPLLVIAVFSGGIGFGGGASVTEQQFSSKLQTKDIEIRKLQQKVTDVEAQKPAFDEQQSQLVKLEQTIKTLQRQLNEKEQQFNQQKQIIPTLKTQLNEKEQQFNQQKQIINALQRKLKQLQSLNTFPSNPSKPSESPSSTVSSEVPISKCTITINHELVPLMNQPTKSLSNRQLVSIKPGQYTPIAVSSNSEWFKINYNGREGWVANDIWSIADKNNACP